MTQQSVSRYGTVDKKAAVAKLAADGTWQVKGHDPRNRDAGHDGWVLLGTGWSTLEEACAATGMT